MITRRKLERIIYICERHYKKTKSPDDYKLVQDLKEELQKMLRIQNRAYREIEVNFHTKGGEK